MTYAGVLVAAGTLSAAQADGWIKWMAISAAVYLMPAIVVLLGRGAVLSFGVWSGVFLLLQGPVIGSLLPRDFKTLPPKMDLTYMAEPGVFPGITGVKRISTDERGFRVDPPVNYSDAAPIRIFAIGASTTEEILLDDRETWTHRLQERLSAALGKRVEVINTGVSGLRAKHHLATLRAISALNPDLVIFLMGVNDWNRQIREQIAPWSKLHSLEAFRLHDSVAIRALRKIKAIPFAEEHSPSQHPAVPKRLSAGADRLVSASVDRVAEHYQEAVAEIVATCRAQVIPCLFLTQPYGYEPVMEEAYERQLWMRPPEASFQLDTQSIIGIADLYNSWLKEFGCESGIAVFDLEARVGKGFVTFFDDVHFHEQGALAVSEALFPYLLAQLSGAPREPDACPARTISRKDPSP